MRQYCLPSNHPVLLYKINDTYSDIKQGYAFFCFCKESKHFQKAFMYILHKHKPAYMYNSYTTEIYVLYSSRV